MGGGKGMAGPTLGRQAPQFQTCCYMLLSLFADPVVISFADYVDVQAAFRSEGQRDHYPCTPEESAVAKG